MKHIPRANARGRGVAIIFRDSISVTVSKHNTYTSMEYLNCLFKVGLELLRIVTIYRPPPKAKSPNVPVFLKEFADLLVDLTLTSGQLLLVGDLNFHFDNPTSAHTKPIIDLLSATNHQQHVTLATHQKGHILDVIMTRRDELPIADITCDESVNSEHCQLSSFVTVTRADITQLLSKSPSKTCKLDPMRTHFVKQCHNVMAGPITNIINKCLIDGMPEEMKAAIITPILKKPSLYSETLKSYRPISNMSFLSKLLERVVADRLIAHMRENYLYMPLQSAYRQNCSTEIALLHVHDSVIRSMDECQGVIMLLIDLSAAFYMIDHAILLNTLSNTISVKDRCLLWFAAYLQHRQYTVLIAGEQSKQYKLTCGVPQGSVLAPLLFTIYLTPLASLLKLHGMTYHLYADDTQLFQEFSLSDNTSPEIAIRKMECCVIGIHQWMKTNMLKLNDDKTEILIIHPKSANQHLLPESVRTGNTNVTPNTHARNLEVTFDCNMSLERHVTNISEKHTIISTALDAFVAI